MKIKIRVMLLCISSYIVPILCMEEQKNAHLASLESIQAAEEYALQDFINNHSKSVPVHTLIEQNNTELKSLKRKIKQKKDDAMKRFRDMFPLTEQCWQDYRSGKKLAIIVNKTYMSRKSHHSPRSHDDDFPFIQYVRKQARVREITDASLCISFNNAKEKDILADAFVTIKCPKAVVSFEEGIVVNAENIRPAQFVMYPSLLLQSAEEQQVICNTMLEYIVEQTATKQEFLIGFLTHHAHTHENDITNSSAWNALQEAKTMKIFSNFCFRYKDQIELLQEMCKKNEISSELFRVLCVIKRLVFQQCHVNSMRTFQ